MRLRSLATLLAALLPLVVALPAGAQSILIDTPVRAGPLLLFPKVRDDKAFYYAPIQPRLARDDRGQPQFSFLRYVQVADGQGTQDAPREGEGGGIVHALVTLSVTPQELEAAQRELGRLHPDARIEGPVVYKSGTFGLVSSFANEKGDLTKQVVGLGRAPVLDGAKAAVSIQLTRLGAKILWESFQTPAPDVSFSFDMELEGYLSPVQATIEADWDRVYEHRSFDVALAGELGPAMLAAEISQAFDELRESRAIRVTQVGDDKQMEAILNTTYNKLIEQMFQPLGGTGAPSLASLSGGAGKPSLLDKASAAYNQRRKEVDQTNEGRRKRNEERTRKHEAAVAARAEAERLERETAELETRVRDFETQAAEAEKRAAVLAAGGATATPDAVQGEQPPPAPAAERAQQLAAAQSDAGNWRRLSEQTRQQAAERRKAAEQARTKATALAADLGDPKESGSVEPLESKPMAQVLASFEIKKIRQTGTFRLDLNKYTSATRNLRFDENIGDLRSLFGDQRHFHQVNLDDPFYRQREIAVFVDGLNANDFGEFVNFVTVHLRKVHGNGQETHEEIRIDRQNFNQEGNRFRMLYGWNGDDDRLAWMSYQYRAIWSFFGGQTVEEPWRTGSAGAIGLSPPFQPRAVTLDADPDVIKEAGVRAITVRLYYLLNGSEHMKQTTLNALRDQLSERITFLLPANQQQYEYEVSWKLRGNKSATSGRQKGNDAILYVDELPEPPAGT